MGRSGSSRSRGSNYPNCQGPLSVRRNHRISRRTAPWLRRRFSFAPFNAAKDNSRIGTRPADPRLGLPGAFQQGAKPVPRPNMGHVENGTELGMGGGWPLRDGPLTKLLETARQTKRVFLSAAAGYWRSGASAREVTFEVADKTPVGRIASWPGYARPCWR